MPITLAKTREFVYQNGLLWERALFAWLFEGGSLDHLYACLRCYRNPDGGYGHAFEPDIRYPGSHPLALEFFLRVLVERGIPPADLLDGVSAWLEKNQQADGTLQNPPGLLAYPHAPWWTHGGQTAPDSITGNLIRLGKASDTLRTATLNWAQAHLTHEYLAEQEWLFMLYHAYDYFFAEERFPQVDEMREATLTRMIALAQNLPEEQYASLMMFAPVPDSPLAKAAPQLIERSLQAIERQWQEEGCWHDQHNLPQWYTWQTITNLHVLRSYGRLG